MVRQQINRNKPCFFEHPAGLCLRPGVVPVAVMFSTGRCQIFEGNVCLLGATWQGPHSQQLLQSPFFIYMFLQVVNSYRPIYMESGLIVVVESPVTAIPAPKVPWCSLRSLLAIARQWDVTLPKRLFKRTPLETKTYQNMSGWWMLWVSLDCVKPENEQTDDGSWVLGGICFALGDILLLVWCQTNTRS